MDVETDFGEEPDLPFDTKETLFRIAQEALHNIVKHANATTVHLRLAEQNSEVVLEIQDDGKGFDVQEDYPGHLGLRSMRERTLHLGGYVTVHSAPGQGTKVSSRIPIPRRQPT